MSSCQRQNDRTPVRGCPYAFGRGAVFFAPSLRGLSADQADWGSVVLKEYTPSVFGYAKSSRLRAAPVAALTVHRTVIHYRDCASLTLREGGDFIAACGDVILQGKMTGRGKPLPYRGAMRGSPGAMSFCKAK